MQPRPTYLRPLEKSVLSALKSQRLSDGMILNRFSIKFNISVKDIWILGVKLTSHARRHNH